MNKNVLSIILIFLSSMIEAKSAVTYSLSGGRLGDNLLAYCHAKWISYKYDIPLLYKPFEYADQLQLSVKELPLTQERINGFEAIIDISKVSSYTIEPNKNILYVIPYFPESIIERENNPRYFYYFPIEWKDPGFNKILRQMISPLYQLAQPEIPNNVLSVALHLRIGTLFDIGTLNEYEEQTKQGINQLKFPPFSFYYKQIERIRSLYPDRDIFIYVFTDHTDPQELVEIIKKNVDCARVSFGYHTQSNCYYRNVLEDFFSFKLFDCVIRPDANFSMVATKLFDFKILISPWHAIRENDEVIIDVINVEEETKSYLKNNLVDPVQEALQKKIVLCTGPAFGKKEQLIDVTSKDIAQIPFKKIFVITNDKSLLDVTFNRNNCALFFTSRGKQLDCLNCIIRSIIEVAKDPECNDDDIMLFKHESVYINDMNLVRKAVGKIVQGYDMVAKYWVGRDHITSLHFNDYYHTDSFFMSVRAARAIYKDLQEIDCFTQEYQFCEEYFTKFIVSKLSKVYKIDYHHSSWKDNELGLYHIPRYEDDPNWYWDKKNYEDLYRN